MSPNPSVLIDRFGRVVNYLRISITDRCDFRCVYCMAEDMTFLPRQQILSLEEIYTIAQAFTELGVSKIRITGGEPLVRKGAVGLLARLSQLPGLNELVLTTNGSQLKQQAAALREAGVKRLNVSLDTLDPIKFRQLTRTGDLDRVLEGLQVAKQQNFARIKLNAVILHNRNHDETIALTRFALEHGFDISFIEEMPLGAIDDHDRAEAYYSSDAIYRDLSAAWTLTPCQDNTGGPSKYYKIAGANSRIGFISPHSHNFCGDCNRVRLTAEGRLLLCLGNEHSMDLKAVLRSHPHNRQALKNALHQAMTLKPEQHHFNLQEQPVIFRHMNVTGG
ncbi:MAG: GTP 3',8-cyclase MoaA [Methylococcales bacterium]|nr:GTP 3',8-cyclase MoaA [Methylococcales bacterium]